MNHPHPFPPPWAEAWGDDPYGLWAELLVKGVTQRMRWLAPGSFMMGSPDAEAERSGDEGPQHWVTLTDDLWLADTACSQALWFAIMGDKNPSHFLGSLDFPVEQVSWLDVQDFFVAFQKLDVLPAGFEAVLPTEAQWEYACRAGTTTPFSFGEQISTDQANFDGDYSYNNSPKGKYRGGTVAVKALPANAWGLYQMHGNVMEWCSDAIRSYTADAVTNPSGATGTGLEYYVVRGGDFLDDPQSARSGERLQYQAASRTDIIGFRFSLRPVGRRTSEGSSGERA